MNIRRILYIILCAAALWAFLGGGLREDYRALEQLRAVRTLGCDRAGEGVRLSASGSAPGEDAPPLRLEAAGSGIREALDALRRRAADGELFFAHTQFVVLGREAAERDAEALLDYALRDESLRLGAWLFVAEGDAAELVAGGDGDFDVTEALISARQALERSGGRTPDLRETAVALREYGAAPVCMLRLEETERGRSLAVSGCGVLRDGRLVAVLSEGESEALGLLRGEPGTRTRAVPGAVMEYDGDAALAPSWTAGGSPGPLAVRLSVRAGVAEGDADPAEAAEALRAALDADLRALLGRLRALDADLPALGRALRLKGGSRFTALPPDWLTRLDFDVSTQVQLTRGYDLNAPAGGAP